MPINPMLLAAGLDAAIGAVSAFGQHRANKKSQDSAREQMSFQERMSNTQYQRAMKDMAEAGLNPILAYSQGGAGTPSGSSSRFEDTLGKGVGTALESRRQRREYEAFLSQKAVNDSLIKYQAAQAAQANSAAALNRQNTEIAKWNTVIAKDDAFKKDIDPRVVASKVYDRVMSSKFPGVVSNSAKSLRDRVYSVYNSVRDKARANSRDRLKSIRDKKRAELFKQYGVK